MTTKHVLRKLWVARCRYGWVPMTAACIMAVPVHALTGSHVGLVAFWAIWLAVPCGLYSLGGFFGSWWFVALRQALGVSQLAIVIFTS